MQKAIIDLSKNGIIPVFHAKQGDTSRRVAITLLDNGLPYDTAADAVSVWYCGPSGEGNYSDGIDKDGSTLTILVNPNMTAASGRHTCAVMLSNESGRCTTWNFCVEVAYTPALGSEEAKAYFEAFEAGELAADIAEVDARTAKAVAELNARVSAIIASGTATEGNTELIDIRTGADGKVDQPAGDAVRGQVRGIKSDLGELKDDLSDNYKHTGIVEPLNHIVDLAYDHTSFTSLGCSAIQGHRYTVVFTTLQSGNYISIGSMSGGLWHGKVDGCKYIGTFTATSNGTIRIAKTIGTSQTIDEVYIFDTTGNDELVSFLEQNKIEAVKLPNGGVAGYLENKIDRVSDIVGHYISPRMKLSDFSFGASAFDDTGFPAVNGNRYTVVFSPLTNALASVGVISGGVWEGKQDGRYYSATFTSQANGNIYFSKTSGDSQTIDDIYIFDTTDDDELLSFIEANLLNTPNVLYGSKIKVESNTWYKRKAFCALGDSVTQDGKWIPYVNKEFQFETITNCGIGGTRVSGEGSTAFWQDTRINTIPTTSDFITVMGGTNDGAAIVPIGDISRDNCDTTTFVGAYNVLISKILYKFNSSGEGYYQDIDYSNITRVSTTKQINILIITCGFCGNSTYAGADFSRMENLANACIEIGKLWSIPVADIYHNTGINPITYPIYLSDNVHPNTDGGKRIASIIIGKMKETEPVE